MRCSLAWATVDTGDGCQPLAPGPELLVTRRLVGFAHRNQAAAHRPPYEGDPPGSSRPSTTPPELTTGGIVLHHRRVPRSIALAATAVAFISGCADPTRPAEPRLTATPALHDATAADPAFVPIYGLGALRRATPQSP